MKVLVTGHSGLIGSHLCDWLVKEDHMVYGISRSSRNGVSQVRDYNFDLRDKKETERVISKIKPQVIFHLAANAAESASVFSPIDITTSGINTFLNVLVPAIKTGKLKKFNFTSKTISMKPPLHLDSGYI